MIARDGYYGAYASVVVRDTKTGFEWAVGPDKDTTWHEVKRWVDTLNVSGGGWRMSTINELKTLYEEGRGSRNMTPLLKTTGQWVWSRETIDSPSAWTSRFYRGSRSKDYYGASCYYLVMRVPGRMLFSPNFSCNESKVMFNLFLF